MGWEWRRRALALAVLVTFAIAARASAQTPDQVGQWSAEQTFPLTLTHSHLLPTGKVMFMGEFSEGTLPPYLWDPANGQLSELSAPPYNIFCAGESFLDDGTLLLTGGHEDSHVGLPYATIFDPFTLQWTQLPDMNDRRWYPTTTTLADGRGITLSGETDSPGTSDGLPQIWNPSTWSWVDLTNAYLELPYYPRTFVAPNGRLFMAGPQAQSRWLDVSGKGAWYNGPKSAATESRTYGSAVMYRPGKIIIMGGGEPPLASAELIDLNASTPTWTSTDPMHYARRQLNATVLPDGRVLVNGGSYGNDFDDSSSPVLAAEVWDPATGHWTVWANQQSYHGYHSTATLLPDGRILYGGGRKIHTVQIFSPPYLFKGPRPTISSAPTSVTPGQSFFVGTPDAASVSRVTLIRITAVTHAFNMNQRFNELSFTQASGGLTVTAPPDNNVAPPGHYLLFLLNGNGVPSVAKIIQLGHAPDDFVHPIVFSDSWRYDDTGVDRGTAWLAQGYDDSRWKTGTGQFGYGEDDEATQVANNGPTTYFRKQISVNGTVTAANLDLLVDDGATVWVNGTQVFAQNMANGTDYPALASASVTNQFVHANIPTTAFVQGTNTIAVEVKQVSSGSPDLSFALALNLKTDTQAPPPPPSLTLTDPNGGETLDSGGKALITWSTGGSVTNVNLDYSLNSGGTWTPIASAIANTGQYTWNVPAVTSTTARVRVRSTADTTVGDASDADFSIAQPSSVQYTAIVRGDTWKYNDSGADPGTMMTPWTTLAFDDSGWKSGPAQLGYGGHGEVTKLTRTSPSQPSVLFRKRITINGTVTAASITTLFDDGVAVYVNGAIVYQKNCDDGLAFSKYASASVNNEVDTASISTSPFLQGDNEIAVMVKQVGPNSPDLEFDLSLALTVSNSGGTVTPTLKVTSPNGGETLGAGTSKTIGWTTTGTVSSVDLAYSLNSGSTWTNIATGVSNTGSYAWTVPSVSSTTARVRVRSSADSTVSDMSDGDFTISTSSTTQVTAIQRGDTWKYLDTGVDPGATWSSATFDDSTWPTGVAQLGYGGHGEVTTLTRTSPSQPSVLFRKKISVSGTVSSASITALFDDGVAVYVNGTLVYQKNCDKGLDFSKYASDSVNNEIDTAAIAASAFHSGDNEVAVMVKQVGKTSPDLEFDLSMTLTVSP